MQGEGRGARGGANKQVGMYRFAAFKLWVGREAGEQKKKKKTPKNFETGARGERRLERHGLLELNKKLLTLTIKELPR